MPKIIPIYFWKRAPFIRLLIPLVAGIIAQDFLHLNIWMLLPAGMIVAACFFLFSKMPPFFQFRHRYFQGALLMVFFMVFGMALMQLRDIKNSSGWFGNADMEKDYFIAVLNEDLQEKEKTYKAEVRIIYRIHQDSLHSVSGEALLYFLKDSITNYPAYGDTLLLNNSLQLISNSGNPGAFDYAAYMARQQIYHRAFLRKDDWAYIGRREGWDMGFALAQARKKANEIIGKYVQGDDEKAMAKALITGYRLDLDRDLVQLYSNAGVVHLIAISGLHLGLIYLLLMAVVRWVPFLRKSELASFLIVIACLWFYTLFTGATASVLRAAVMFSFVSLGVMIKRRSVIYNTLFASAFLLLCYDPMLLWDVGFQLSYLAVFGIVLLSGPIYNLIYFKNKLLKKIWKLCAVSIAAQLLTLPLCMYYFHQVPLLFLLANLIAIPLASWALWAGLAVLAVSWIPAVAWVMGSITSWLLWLMNHWVMWINELPLVVWGQIQLKPIHTLLLYSLLGAMIYWWFSNSKKALLFSLSLFLIFLLLRNINQWQLYRQHTLIVYNVSGHRAADFITQGRYTYLGDNIKDSDRLSFQYNIRPARLAWNADVGKSIFHLPQLYTFGDKEILFIDSAINFKEVHQRLHFDYLILSENARVKIAEIAKAIDCHLVIFDGSNSYYTIRKWKKECEALHLRTHTVATQGAFVATF